jgi:hypothetical protein
MSDIPMNEQECQQDVLKRIHKWLNVLEERIILLMNANNLDEMKPGECEQAISRHLMLILRLLQLRQQHAQAAASPGEQALLDALLRSMDDE